MIGIVFTCNILLLSGRTKLDQFKEEALFSNISLCGHLSVLSFSVFCARALGIVGAKFKLQMHMNAMV